MSNIGRITHDRYLGSMPITLAYVKNNLNIFDDSLDDFLEHSIQYAVDLLFGVLDEELFPSEVSITAKMVSKIVLPDRLVDTIVSFKYLNDSNTLEDIQESQYLLDTTSAKAVLRLLSIPTDVSTLHDYPLEIKYRTKSTNSDRETSVIATGVMFIVQDMHDNRYDSKYSASDKVKSMILDIARRMSGVTL